MHNLFLAWASYLLAILLPSVQSDMVFYSEHFKLTYHPTLFSNGPLVISDEGISKYYNSITEKDWTLLHHQLQNKRDEFNLNDWMYSKLVHESVEKIAHFASKNEKRLIEFHLMSLAGFQMRLCYLKSNIFVYGKTNDDLYEIPIIKHQGNKFINLSVAFEKNKGFNKSLTMHPLNPQPQGKSISFLLDQIPTLSPIKQNRTFKFSYKNEHFEIEGITDATIASWMHDYPFFDEGQYITAPMSLEPQKKLIGELNQLIKGRSTREKLEFLASFTRGAFTYKEDKESFGYSKPMIPDEVLFYPVSDCEDRSAIFFFLVKEMLNLPVVAIAYDDHLSVAVASKSIEGQPLRLFNKTFFICDPTGPKDSWQVGNPPFGYQDRNFIVVAKYLPKET